MQTGTVGQISGDLQSGAPTAEGRKCARRLRREHRELRSWRKVSRQFYEGGVAPGTLNRIYKTKGAYLPKSAAQRNLLKLSPAICGQCHRKIAQPVHHFKKWTRLNELSEVEILHRLLYRTEMQ